MTFLLPSYWKRCLFWTESICSLQEPLLFLQNRSLLKRKSKLADHTPPSFRCISFSSSLADFFGKGGKSFRQSSPPCKCYFPSSYMTCGETDSSASRGSGISALRYAGFSVVFCLNWIWFCFQIITWSSLDWLKSDLRTRWEIDSILGTTFDIVVHVCMVYHLGQYLSTVQILAALVLVQAVVMVLLFGPYYAWASPNNIPPWIQKRIHPEKVSQSWSLNLRWMSISAGDSILILKLKIFASLLFGGKFFSLCEILSIFVWLSLHGFHEQH